MPSSLFGFCHPGVFCQEIGRGERPRIRLDCPPTPGRIVRASWAGVTTIARRSTRPLMAWDAPCRRWRRFCSIMGRSARSAARRSGSTRLRKKRASRPRSKNTAAGSSPIPCKRSPSGASSSRATKAISPPSAGWGGHDARPRSRPGKGRGVDVISNRSSGRRRGGTGRRQQGRIIGSSASSSCRVRIGSPPAVRSRRGWPSLQGGRGDWRRRAGRWPCGR